MIVKNKLPHEISKQMKTFEDRIHQIYLNIFLSSFELNINVIKIILKIPDCVLI